MQTVVVVTIVATGRLIFSVSVTVVKPRTVKLVDVSLRKSVEVVVSVVVTGYDVVFHLVVDEIVVTGGKVSVIMLVEIRTSVTVIVSVLVSVIVVGTVVVVVIVLGFRTVTIVSVFVKFSVTKCSCGT